MRYHPHIWNTSSSYKLLKTVAKNSRSFKLGMQIFIGIKRALIFYHIGRWDEAEKILKVILKNMGKIKQSEFAADVRRSLGDIVLRRGKANEALLLFSEAGNIYKREGNKRKFSDILAKKGLTYRYKEEYDKSLQFYQQKLALDRVLGNKVGMSIAIGNMAIVHDYQGDWKTAIKYYKRQLNISKDIKDRYNESIVLGNLGALYRNMQNFPNATKCFNDSLAISKNISYRMGMSIVLTEKGNLYDDMGNPEKAIESYKKALELAITMGNSRGIAYCSGNMGMMNRDIGKYKKALEYMNKALVISKELGDQRSIGLSYGNIGTLFKAQKKYKKAEQYYSKAIAVQRKFKHQPFLCKFLYEKADLHFTLKDFDRAGTLNKEAGEIAEKVGRSNIIMRSALLNTRLLSLRDKTAAIKQLKELLQTAKEKHIIAMIYEELFKLTRKHLYRSKTIALCHNLFKSTGKIVYKQKRDYLKDRKSLAKHKGGL